MLAGTKIEVESNGLDLAKAERDGEGMTVMGMRLMHQACLRNRVENVPTSFESFCRQLDEFEDVTDADADADDDLGPTQLAD